MRTIGLVTLTLLFIPDALAGCPKDTKAFKRKHDNGALKSKGCVLLDGGKHGPWEDYDTDGNLIAAGEYEKNKKVGLWTTYFANGVTETECSYAADAKQGACLTYAASGVMITEENYSKGRREGAYTAYYESGTKREEGTYVADFSKEGVDHKDGIWTSYHPNGSKSVLAEFSHGEASGAYREYYPDGTVRLLGQKAADQLVKEVTTWHDTGRKSRVGTFREGKLEGPVVFFARSGRKLEEVSFRDDTRHGISVIFDKKENPILWQCFQYGDRQWVSDQAEKSERPKCPDRTGVVFRPAIQEGKAFSEGLAAVKIGGKWGFINEYGQVRIAPRFDDAGHFVQGVAAVSSDEGATWYAIDETGTRLRETEAPSPTAKGNAGGISRKEANGVIDYQRKGRSIWAAAESTPEAGPALFPVAKDGKWGFIDETGALKLPAIYQQAGRFSEGMAAVGQNGRVGYIDASGAMIIPATYTRGRAFHCGMAAVEIDGSLTFVDRYGLRVTERAISSVRDCSNALAPVQVDEKWGYLHSSGRMLINPRFENADAFSEGFAQATSERGYIDRTGRLVYEGITPVTAFSDGFAIANDVKTGNDNFVVIDAQGTKTPIAQESKGRGSLSFHPFSDGLALVGTPDGFGFIGTKGEVAIAPSHQAARPFSEGLAAVQAGKNWGFVKTDGETAIKPSFEEVSDFQDGVAAARSKGKWGYIDTSGAWIVEPTYDEAAAFSRGLGHVRAGEAWGWVNATGKVVWKPSK